jgi:hypothetical protein
MAQDFIAIQERRAQVYNNWNSALRKFTDTLEPRMSPSEYQEVVLEATQELKELREAWMTTTSGAEGSVLGTRIAELEDKHLGVTIKYHSLKIRQQQASYLEAARLEEEISDLVLELKFLV